MKYLLPETIMDWIILVVIVSAYLILIVETLRKRGIKSQSFFSNLLWTILDILALAIMSEVKSESLVLVLGGAFCSFIMSILLIKYDKGKLWKEEETQTLIIILIVLCFWKISGSNLLGVSLAVIAEIIAGWPQMKKSWTNPGTRLTLLSYIIFFAGYVLTLIRSSENWQLKNVLLPIAFIMYSIGDTYPLIRKWIRIQKRYMQLNRLEIN